MRIGVSVTGREWGGKQSWMLEAAAALQRASHDVGLAVEPGGVLCERARRAGHDVVEVAFNGAGAAPVAVITGADLVLMTGRNDARVVTQMLDDTDASAVRVLMRHSPFALADDQATSAMLSSLAAVILTSQAQRASWSGVEPERVHVVRSAIDTRRYAPRPACQARVAELGLMPGAPVVGCFGRLSWEKGQAVLLRALGRLPGVVAVIAGDGPDAQSLAALAADLGVQERVRFLGLRHDVDALLSLCSAVVVPSLEGETGPLALKEAMAAGVPVVATRIGGIAEIVDDDHTGLLVAPDDPDALASALGRLLESPDLAGEIGAAGRRAVLARDCAAQRERAFVGLLEALYLEHGRVERFLCGRRWAARLRVRREQFGALLFVPASSFVVELPHAAVALVERSISDGDLDVLLGLAATEQGRALIADLHRTGALTATPSHS